MTDTNLAQLTENYAALGIGKLTVQEEIYVQRRAQGINPSAAARAANYPQPALAVAQLAQREDINLAIAYAREMMRQYAIREGAMAFTKDDATELYLEAHATSANSMEKIRAIDSLVKLHGLAAPEVKQVQITSKTQMQALGDEELMKLAGQDILLSPEQYMEVSDDDEARVL